MTGPITRAERWATAPVAWFGAGAIDGLGKRLDECGAASILLVSGRDSFALSGAAEALEGLKAGRHVLSISVPETNPKVRVVRDMIDNLRETDFEAIVGVGGGSVIDVAKMIKAFMAARNPLHGWITGDETLCPVDKPLYVIPTTAGSGSEATHFAVVYDGTEKYSVAHPALLPKGCFLDPRLLDSLPPQVCASSGMDALCQGIESYWSIHSTDGSRHLAREAITLAWENLEPAVADADPQARSRMMRAAHLAGRAINITKTTAPHAVSYAVTTLFGIPHGHAVGLILPSFLTFNAAAEEDDLLDKRGVGFVSRRLEEIVELLGARDAHEASALLLQLLGRIGLETDLESLGIKGSSAIEAIVENGFNPERVNNNPRRLDRSALQAMLEERIGVSRDCR